MFILIRSVLNVVLREPRANMPPPPGLIRVNRVRKWFKTSMLISSAKMSCKVGHWGPGWKVCRSRFLREEGMYEFLREQYGQLPRRCSLQDQKANTALYTCPFKTHRLHNILIEGLFDLLEVCPRLNLGREKSSDRVHARSHKEAQTKRDWQNM